MSLLRWPHDHHREVRTRLNTALSANTTNCDQDRYVMITIAPSQIHNTHRCAGRSTTPALAQLRASDPSLYTLCIALHRPNQIPTLTTKRSCAATPSINALNRVGCPRAPHRRRSNPHRARCTIASHFPRFRPLEGFVRRPPECLAPSVRGRHPKPFTKADICSAANSAKIPPLVGGNEQHR
jgi:hypothetical protein